MINLTRVDYRLIHGQVITTWVKRAQADTIIIADDELAENSFLAEIYVMAAPPDIEIIILPIEEVAQNFKNGIYEDKKILILFKSIQALHKAVEVGLDLKDVQVGGLGSGSGKKSIVSGVAMDEEELRLLSEISDKGTEVYVHVFPTEPRLSLDEAKKKFGYKG